MSTSQPSSEEREPESARALDRRARALLWLDAGAGASAGCVVLALHSFFAALHAFSVDLVLFIGVVNLAYASYSGTLAVLALRGRAPSRRAVELLIFGNLAWAPVCVMLILRTWHSATLWGHAHVGIEALFVTWLASAEYRFVRPLAG